MLLCQLKPVVKDSIKSKNDSSNYRPIMVCSNIFKTFEYCFLDMLQRNIRINNHQFGFRKEVSCLTAGTIVKETILNYTNKESSVHCTQIDFSKAYDKLNRYILIDKLITLKLCPIFILLLLYIF